MSDITKANFDSSLDTVVKSNGTLRQQVQNITDYAMGEALANGNTAFLDKIFNADLHGVNTAKLQQYVQDHIGYNLSIDKDGDVKKFSKNKDFDDEKRHVPEGVNWWTYGVDNTMLPEVNPMKALSQLIKQLEAGKEGEKRVLAEGTEHQADIMLKTLSVLQAETKYAEKPTVN